MSGRRVTAAGATTILVVKAARVEAAGHACGRDHTMCSRNRRITDHWFPGTAPLDEPFSGVRASSAASLQRVTLAIRPDVVGTPAE
jgi:hypothetical protein